MSPISEPEHPGRHIRSHVIPNGMSVTKAASLVGVGRPALSNLLNGNSALTADMAARLEKAFGCSRDSLLRMQADYDTARARLEKPPSGTRTYVPPFLQIRANQIQDWVKDNIGARSRLAVFLRTLVCSTGRGLTKVDFPGNDDAERSGWDGFVEADEPTPWIPAGQSGWEFGTNKDIKGKADSDFEKSVGAIPPEERREVTFVFVSPRRWPGKAAWASAMNVKGLWKNVRAYDASDLEQWLAQSLPGQAWFANEAALPALQVRSLDKCWDDWANVADPPMVGGLFDSAIADAKRIMLSRMRAPSGGPIIVAADSNDEALAFLAQLFGERGGHELATYRDRVIVFDKPGVLPSLANGAAGFIPVTCNRDVERELAPYAKSVRSIIVYPRNDATTKPDVLLEPAGWEPFEKALEEIGKSRDEIVRLTNESGRSLTVLRRRLATMPAVRKPPWAADPAIARSLVTFALVGAWHSANEADQIAVSLLGGEGCSYAELERTFQRLCLLDDTPVWSIGTYRGVISKIDLLHAISSVVTPQDLARYFSIARLVLDEDDPSLDLPEDLRWAANLFGKSHLYSSTFRDGVCETLVMLAVHGDSLFKQRIGIDCGQEAGRVVDDLLQTPLTTRRLQTHDRNLPTYAEAAPNQFLSILERDLKTENAAVLGLLRPAGSSLMGHPSRTGLLWALEGLAWNPETLPRATLVLARLAQVEINDNWANKPINSLESIFRVWMPQTAANHVQRLAVLKKLAEIFPDVAWKVCVNQLSTQHGMGNYSHKPRWRPDGYGFGEPFKTWEPILKFQRDVLEIVLNWKAHDLKTLGDLVERLRDLDARGEARVWALIEAWAKHDASDTEKAEMREKLRISTLSRRAALRARKNKNLKRLIPKARSVYELLEPSDVVNKHAWLFRDTWVDESADELENVERIDYKERDERIRSLRREAMREVLAERGLPGLLLLANRGKASWHIGALSASELLTDSELPDFLMLAIKAILANDESTHAAKEVVAGALRAIENQTERESLIRRVSQHLGPEDRARILTLAPFDKRTWSLIDDLGAIVRAVYWKEVTPDWRPASDLEQTMAIERLLEAKRPRGAFWLVHFAPEKLDGLLLHRVLSEIAKGGDDKPGEYMLSEYDIGKAFEHLSRSRAVTLEQKALLEFAFLEALHDDDVGIPNLERYIDANPIWFVQAIAWVYRREDGGTDPTEFHVPEERRKAMAQRGYRLLEALRRIPGRDEQGILTTEGLGTWIANVRQLCAELDRSMVGDHTLGKWLAHAPIGNDGVWPCEAVRNVMEEVASDDLMDGARIGVYNSRGFHARGEGGDQERALAEKYRRWGTELQFSHPYVSSTLLLALARQYEREGGREDDVAGIRRRLR